MPTTDTAVWWNSDFDYKTANYAPIALGVVIIAVGIWWLVSARHWFKGPIRTMDEEFDAAESQLPPPSDAPPAGARPRPFGPQVSGRRWDA